MHKITAYVDDSQVLHICPKNAMEAIWAKHWTQEYSRRGPALINVHQDSEVYKTQKAAKEEVK